jgi:hypothetical protein
MADGERGAAMAGTGCGVAMAGVRSRRRRGGP